jgi:hypothetical protein
MPVQHPHRDVADRLRFFLDAVNLSRQQFVRAVGGVIGERSLYSVLNGARRPSRALALLIERTWGFRAEYLLSGRGEVWTEAQALGPGVVALELSPAEAAMIKFMRSSVENARTLEGALDHAEVWSRVFGHTLSLVRELDALGASGSELDRQIYPLLVKIVYEECRFAARQYEQLVTLASRRRVHKLTDDFLVHFLDDVPRGSLPSERQEALRDLLRPVLEQRRRRLHAIERALDQVRTTIDNLCRLGSPVARLRARSRSDAARRRSEAMGRLTALADGPLGQELQLLLAEMGASEDPATDYWARLQKLLRDLLKEMDQEIPSVEAVTLEELQARHDALLDPLTA